MNILLADDHTLFQESLEMVLKTLFQDSSITSTKNWPETTRCTDNFHFDLLLLDLFMPNADADGWESSLRRVVDSKNSAICIISASKNRAHIQNAFEIGAKGYICKTSSLKQMKQALVQVSAGKTYLPEQLWRKEPDTEGRSKLKQLTWRQRETLELLIAGDSNKAIALKLGLAESTIKRHVSNLYSTLGVNNRANAIRIAQQENLLSH